MIRYHPLSPTKGERVRINVYDEEVTGEVQVVRKTADTGVSFTGFRVLLASPAVLHNKPGDDDRSAVTFWCQSNRLEEIAKYHQLFGALTKRTAYEHATAAYLGLIRTDLDNPFGEGVEAHQVAQRPVAGEPLFTRVVDL